LFSAVLWSDELRSGRGRKRIRRRFEAALSPLEDRRLLSMFNVTSTADSGSTGTLRWAVAGANADTSPSMIVFELGTAAATITLTQGQLDLSNTSESVSVYDGAGEGPVTISGNGQSGAFQVNAGVTASISGLTITDGATLVPTTTAAGSINDLGTLTLSNCTITNNPKSTTPASGVVVDGTATITDCTITGGNSYYGAGVDVFRGVANLTGCTIENNTGAGDVRGAGLFNGGTTTLMNCRISGNTATNGGGLYNSTFGQIRAYGSMIGDNTSSSDGAGVYNRGFVYLSGCTVSGNSNQSSGGGIWNGNGGTITLSGCTISGNSAFSGGGLSNEGKATVAEITISQNNAQATGGGMANGLVHNSAVLTVLDSTISGNTISDKVVSGGGGAGVTNFGVAALFDSTIANNVADNGSTTVPSSGGGLDDSGTATLVDCTISGNKTTANGGGVYVGGTGALSVSLNNTIVAANYLAPTVGNVTTSDIATGSSAAIVSGSNDLVGTGGSGGLANGTDGNIVLTSLVKLDMGSLGNNGGPTETIQLLPGSHAIGAGSLALEVGPRSIPITTDQRGQPLDAPNPDIGAYQTPPPVSLSFLGLTNPGVPYGTPSVTISGALIRNGQAPPMTENIQISLGGATNSVPFGSNGAFTTTFDTSSLNVSGSPYTISYSYTGDATFAPASTAGTLSIIQFPPNVHVMAAGGTYNGAPFGATATVAGISGSSAASLEGVTPTLSYYAGITASGTPLASAPTDAGIYTALAKFAGSPDYAANSAATQFTISPATPIVSVAVTGGSYNGSPFVATSTVTGLGGLPASSLEGVTPTLSYYAGTTAAGTPLAGAPSAAGTYTVVAKFGGSSDYAASSSTPSTFMISPAAPAVNAAINSGTYNGSPFNAIATVTGLGGSPASSLEGVTPKLSYYAGTSAASSALSAAPTAAGTYTVVANFPGSADYVAASSTAVTFTIGQASVNITLARSSGSTVYGQAVTFVAAVAAVTPTTGAPTGSVTFVDGPNPLETVRLDVAGIASLTLSKLAVGSHSITAIYDPTANFLGNTSGSASETVAQARSQVVLTPHPVLKKKQLVSVNLTAEIEPVAPGAGVPTGNVVFEILTTKGKKTQTQTLGKVSLKNGQATLLVAASSVLNQSITIVYGGNTDFRAVTAASPKLTQQKLG
jgi:hypothetical protein